MAKKSKEYVFKFGGSKEAFLNRLRQLTNDNDRERRFFYFDHYIVDVRDDEISFGVGRAGHSGGYWFVSHFAEENEQMEFRGTVQYIGPEDDRTKGRKAFDNVLFVLFSSNNKNFEGNFDLRKRKEKNWKSKKFNMNKGETVCFLFYSSLFAL